MTKYQGDLQSTFKKGFALESADFILTNNTLTFDSKLNSKFCLHIKETTMGTTFKHTYANLTNLTMGYHEIEVYFSIRQSYTLASK